MEGKNEAHDGFRFFLKEILQHWHEGHNTSALAEHYNPGLLVQRDRWLAKWSSRTDPDKRIKQKKRSPGAHCPILNNTRHLSKWVHLDQNNSRLIWRQNDPSKANTLINSEKLPVVVALDRMEYCLGKMFMNEIYLIDYLVTGWPSSNWPLTTRCWPECLAEGHCFFRVNLFTEEVALKLT